MAKKKQPDSKERFYGENNSGHYNFVIIDRELIFITDTKGKNIQSTLNLSLEALGLYVILKAHAIDKNYVWPSLPTIAKYANKSINTVQKYIDELIESGLIVKEKQDNPRGGQQINIYIIPAIEKERIKHNTILDQLSKSDSWVTQQSKSDSCNSQNLPLANSQNLTSNNTNINILNELRLKARFKEIPSDIEDGFIKLFDTMKSDKESYVYLSDDNLIIKYKFEAAIRRDVNILLDSIGLFETINVIYEN